METCVSIPDLCKAHLGSVSFYLSFIKSEVAEDVASKERSAECCLDRLLLSLKKCENNHLDLL